ncbi:ATP-binding protein [Mycoplasmatota bacterium]|nr:ATP-binding protein [Mycoplasmatota bacterium]
MNEIVIVSGKGGTGKTTLAASLIPFFGEVVIADCDVDAPDLDILLDTSLKYEEDFVGLKRAKVNNQLCVNCGLCYEKCNFNAIDINIEINKTKCEGCGVCEYICPVDAITMEDSVVGQIFQSGTEFGDIVHAKLIPGEETSGKLVAEVRSRAKALATKNKIKNIIIDGSPGIACNVISSITGTSKAIIVIEPTLSGLHDLEKIHSLVNKFRIPILIVINKCDLSRDESYKIEKYCFDNDLEIALKIPFDRTIVEGITKKKIPSLYNHELFKSIGFNDFIDKLKIN